GGKPVEDGLNVREETSVLGGVGQILFGGRLSKRSVRLCMALEQRAEPREHVAVGPLTLAVRNPGLVHRRAYVMVVDLIGRTEGSQRRRTLGQPRPGERKRCAP